MLLKMRDKVFFLREFVYDFSWNQKLLYTSSVDFFVIGIKKKSKIPKIYSLKKILVSLVESPTF